MLQYANTLFLWVLKEIKYLSEKKRTKIEKKGKKKTFLWINKCLNHLQSCCKYLNRKK